MLIRSLQDRSIGGANPFNRSGVVKAKFYANASIKKYDPVALDDYGRAMPASYIFNNNLNGKFVNYAITSSPTSGYDYRADMIQLDKDNYVMAAIVGSNTIQVDVYKKAEPVRSNSALQRRAYIQTSLTAEGLSLAKVNDTMFAINYRAATGAYWYIVIGQFDPSAGTLSFGSAFTLWAGTIKPYTTAVSLGNNRIVVFCSRNDNTAIYGQIVDVIDKNNLNLRGVTTISAEMAEYMRAVALNDTEIILAFSGAGVGKAVGIDVQGNALVSGTPTVFYPNQSSYGLDLRVWKGNTAFATYRDGGSPNYCRISKITKNGTSLSTTWTAMPNDYSVGQTQVVFFTENLGAIFGVSASAGSIWIWPFTIDANGNYTLQSALSSSLNISSVSATHILAIDATKLLIMNNYVGNHYYGLLSDIYYKDAIGIALNDASAGQTVDVALI
jgi:hypothetical protein